MKTATILAAFIAFVFALIYAAPAQATTIPSECTGMGTLNTSGFMVIPETPDNAYVVMGTAANDLIVVPATVTDAMVLGMDGDDCIVFLNSRGMVGIGMNGDDVIIVPDAPGDPDTRIGYGDGGDDEGFDQCFGSYDVVVCEVPGDD